MEFEPIKSGSTVIRRSANDWIAVKEEMFKVDSMIKKIWSNISTFSEIDEDCKLRGIPAEVLEEGENWKRGRLRVKISVEFCESDETELTLSEPEASNWPPEPES